MTHTEAEIIALAKECGALTHMESGLLYFEPSQLQAFAARLSAPDAQLVPPTTRRERARRLYEQHQQHQTGVKPIPWADAPNEVKREWLDKANIAQPVQPADATPWQVVRAALVAEIEHAALNDMRLPPSFGRALGRAAVPSETIEAVLQRFDESVIAARRAT